MHQLLTSSSVHSLIHLQLHMTQKIADVLSAGSTPEKLSCTPSLSDPVQMVSYDFQLLATLATYRPLHQALAISEASFLT